MPDITVVSSTPFQLSGDPALRLERMKSAKNAAAPLLEKSNCPTNNAVKELEHLHGDRKLGIEESFVWPEGTRPDIAHDKYDFQLPVIDLAPTFQLARLRRELLEEDREHARTRRPGIEDEIAACETAAEGVANAIRAACEEYGFFQIVNHGFPLELAEQLYECCKHIFDRPLEEKMKATEDTPLPVPGGGSSLGAVGTGYAPMKRSTPFTKHNKKHIWNEGFNIFWPEIQFPDRLEQITRILWPGSCSQHGQQLRLCAEEYAKQSSNLVLSLLNLMAGSLGLPKGSVEELLGSLEDNRVFGRVRVNHYPVCANPQLTWGLQGHTDPSIITLLHQDAVGGLQICFKDGTWHGVQPIAGALVVNVGDYLQAWTNRRFLSAEHRAVANLKSPRYSIAYFAWPLQRETVVSPRPELVDAEHPPRYRPFTHKEYFVKLVALGVGRDRDGFMDRAFGVHNNVLLKDLIKLKLRSVIKHGIEGSKTYIYEAFVTSLQPSCTLLEAFNLSEALKRARLNAFVTDSRASAVIVIKHGVQDFIMWFCRVSLNAVVLLTEIFQIQLRDWQTFLEDNEQTTTTVFSTGA